MQTPVSPDAFVFAILMIALPNQLERVILTGFMGSGKTTVGRLLAQRLCWSFVDLDDAVEAQGGLTVPQIFERHGEHAFRIAEVEALTRLLGREHAVIALGGGAAATPAIRELIAGAPRTVVVHLNAEFELLEERCSLQALDPAATARPLLRDAAAARSLYERRSPLYAALAQHRVDVSRSEPPGVVEAILAALATSAESSVR